MNQPVLYQYRIPEEMGGKYIFYLVYKHSMYRMECLNFMDIFIYLLVFVPTSCPKFVELPYTKVLNVWCISAYNQPSKIVHDLSVITIPEEILKYLESL